MTKEIMAECLDEATRIVEGLKQRADIEPEFLEVMNVATIAAALYQERMRTAPIKTLPNGRQVVWTGSKWEPYETAPSATGLRHE